MDILSRQQWQAWWNAESYPSINDLYLFPVFALCFPAVRYVLDTYIFERAGRRYVFRRAGPALMAGVSDADRAALEKTHNKFKESCWKSCYYFTAETFALSITYDEPWFTNSRMFWVGPGDQVWPDIMVKTKLKLFYSFTGGFYMYSIFALVFWETRRKDFSLSMGHHIATTFLIVTSYLARFSRICSLVVALHDASDVFLELAKLSNYSQFELGATLNFALFALTWLVLRILYFPLHVIRSTSIEVLSALRIYAGMWWVPFVYYFFNSLLIMLYVLHLYWFVLILRVIHKQIFAGALKDARSDDEDDD